VKQLRKKLKAKSNLSYLLGKYLEWSFKRKAKKLNKHLHEYKNKETKKTDS
jgi:hypothetical protein